MQLELGHDCGREVNPATVQLGKSDRLLAGLAQPLWQPLQPHRESVVRTHLSGWDTFGSGLSRVAVSDAPNGHYMVRVSALNPSGDYSIDDNPDTVDHSIAGRRYMAEAWVKGTEATDGKLVCLGLRERAGPQGDSVGQAYAGVVMSAADYREVRVAYVAKGTGNRVDVHMFSNRPAGRTGDAFLADAISIT